MPELILELPSMYGDHHVTAVRDLLFDLKGVEDVYASSSFQLVEVKFDDAVIDEGQIKTALADAGYLGEMPMPTESGKPAVSEKKGETFFRHTAAFEHTGKVISFTQRVPDSSRPLWPCPGIGVIKPKEEELTHG